jgi:hypothetical protein
MQAMIGQPMNESAPHPSIEEEQSSFPLVGERDLSLIEHTLRLSYEERIQAHESTRELVKDLMEAGRAYYERQLKSPT